MSIVADAAAGCADDVRVLVLIVRVPNRPSRSKTILIPSVRRKVCARRDGPVSARGLFGQPYRLMPTCKSSDALPVHFARSAMISHTQAPPGRRPRCSRSRRVSCWNTRPVGLAKKLLAWAPQVQLRDGLMKTIGYFEHLLNSDTKDNRVPLHSAKGGG
jgi:hypothetical protein